MGRARASYTEPLSRKIYVNVTGTLSPDATCNYVSPGHYGGVPYAQRQDEAYHIWYDSGGDVWNISVELGVQGTAYWTKSSGDITGAYTAGGTATGEATVALGSH
jgi:hypothetical protein